MQHKMDKNIKKNLIRYIVFMFTASIALIICVISIFYAAQRAEKESHVAYVSAVLGEYQLRFEEQISSDFNVLYTIAEMLQNEYISRGDIIRDTITDFPRYSKFIKIGYYDISAQDTFITLPGSNTQYEFSNRPLEEQRVIREAWKGNDCISQIYSENGINQVCYTIPLYTADGMIEGALTSLMPSDELTDILDTQINAGPSIDLIWIDENYNIISQSHDHALSNNLNELLHITYDSKDTFDNWSDKISHQHITHTHINFDNTEYPVFLANIKYNNWSLVYFDTEGALQSPIYATSLLIMAIFIVLMIICFFIILYTFRYIKKDTNTITSLSDLDQLTSLYNIGKFLEQSAETNAQYYKYNLVILNFRHFHHINTVFGRNSADLLLMETARILKSSLSGDELACRYKGDEFCLLARNSTDLEKRVFDIIDKISDISEKLNNSYSIKLYAGISAPFGQSDNTLPVSDMLNQAECAIKTLKNGYDNQVAFYNESIQEYISFQNELEGQMETALMNKEFKLYLQPKKNLQTGKFCSAEALVRWVRPDSKILYPNKFIPLFESNGFCANLDLYMVEEVCALQKKWLDEGRELFPISVNQSKLLFFRNEYVDYICSITDCYEIPRSCIILEILESLGSDDTDALRSTINALREKGFQVSMDDFGSGYSSLNTFTAFDLDEIKLDRDFLMSIDNANEEKQKKLMESIISIAHNFGIRTVTEGVETAEQEEFLRSIGCNIGQGYLYSKPIPADEFEEKFRS